jgi:hypothetical protein
MSNLWLLIWLSAIAIEGLVGLIFLARATRTTGQLAPACSAAIGIIIGLLVPLTILCVIPAPKYVGAYLVVALATIDWLLIAAARKTAKQLRLVPQVEESR